MKLDRIDELSKRYGISYTNLDGMADRLRTATEQEFKELKSFYLPSARNRKVSPEEFEAAMRKRSTTGDSFRYYKKPSSLVTEPELDPKPELDINNMSRKELLEYAAQKGLTLTGTTELMRDRLRKVLNRGATLKAISEFSTKQDEQLLEQAETEPTKTEPTKTELTDADFYIRTCTVDWDCLVVDMSLVDLKKAAKLVRLATRSRTGIPISVPVLIEYNAESDVKSVWRVVAKHTHAYAAIKLAKAWGKDCTVEWGKHKPCEASGMVRVNTLNACSVGVGLGKEQPSEQYIADVLAMLDQHTHTRPSLLG